MRPSTHALVAISLLCAGCGSGEPAPVQSRTAPVTAPTEGPMGHEPDLMPEPEPAGGVAEDPEVEPEVEPGVGGGRVSRGGPDLAKRTVCESVVGLRADAASRDVRASPDDSAAVTGQLPAGLIRITLNASRKGYLGFEGAQWQPFDGGEEPKIRPPLRRGWFPAGVLSTRVGSCSNPDGTTVSGRLWGDPDITGEPLAILDGEESMAVVGCHERWLLVKRDDGTLGWIHPENRCGEFAAADCVQVCDELQALGAQ